MPVSVIIAAGGAGLRLGAGRPKALVLLGDRPLFLHSARTFASLPEVREIVLVLPREWVDRVVRGHAGLLRKLRVAKIVPGGPRRQDSVRNGLEMTDPRCPIVLVHDAARPFVTPGVIRRVVAAARRHGAAVPVVPVTDTVKVVDGRGRVLETPARERLRAVQTPQGFRREVLIGAFRRAGRLNATDDAQLVERAGGRVVAVEGDPANFKVTTPDDLARAAVRLHSH